MRGRDRVRPGRPAGRSVVITGASRGLGLASAVHLYRRGWRVVAAMRDPDAGSARIREATGAAPSDPRLRAVQLDLTRPESIRNAAKEILGDGGAPFGLVHNAGVVSVGCVEEFPPEAFEDIVATNLLGPARLTAELLPAMRDAGRGRVVAVSSETALHGLAAMGAYSASKAGLERWAEALAMEISPFGLGVTVLITGTFDTDVLDRAHTVDHGNPDGAYGFIQAGQHRLEQPMRRFARPPSQFARVLEAALQDRPTLVRRTVGPDAVAFRVARAVLPARLVVRAASTVMGIPRRAPVTPGQRRET